jgi:predicted dehydrogenase
VKVGVVGTGFGLRVVAPALAAAGCDVVDVVSARDDAAVRTLATSRSLDLLSIHSPPFLHGAHVRYALARGLAVLCDKPFGMHADESAALEAEAADAGAVALLNFEFRYAPARAALYELIRAGRLGTIEHVHWSHLSAGSRVPLRPWGWLFDRARGGGWIGAWASHAVDALRWLFDAEVEVVGAQPRIDVRRRPDATGALQPCTAEDGLSATLRLDSALAPRATVAIDSSFAQAGTVAPRLVVFGAEAVAEVVSDENIFVRDARTTESDHAFAMPSTGDRHDEPMLRYAQVVRRTVERDSVEAGTPTFTDGAACARVLDQLRSAPLV